MSADLVLYESRPPEAVLTMNRPDRRNALNRELITRLAEAFARARDDTGVRAVILTGAGTAFCAGMDLAELSATLDQPNEAEIVRKDASRLFNLYELIYTLPKPTIAAVNGAAVAGGAGLMTVCDLAVAATEAKFGYPEVLRGLVAAMVLPHLLRHVGERAARDLLLRARLIDAAEAQRIGLINAIAAPGELVGHAVRWAQELAEAGPHALSATKELLREFGGRCTGQPQTGQPQSARHSADARLTVECKDGLRAFLEKRPAPWTRP